VIGGWPGYGIMIRLLRKAEAVRRYPQGSQAETGIRRGFSHV